jgi:O-antigen chain-terminating methyltransferase
VSNKCLIIDKTGSKIFTQNCFKIELAFENNLNGREIKSQVIYDNHVLVTLPVGYENIRGVFEEQILNQFFTDKFLQIRPEFVVFKYICGATLDLIRLAKIFGAVVIATLPSPDLTPTQGSRAMKWLSASLFSADAFIYEIDPLNHCDNLLHNQICDKIIRPAELLEWIETQKNKIVKQQEKKFDYGLYEFGMRDHALLSEMQTAALSFFKNSKKVLDLASGAGIFLDILNSYGINSEGVERNTALVKYSRELGFKVYEADALDYLGSLEKNDSLYDGIHCSHFIEHLPIEAVEKLIYLIYNALEEEGIVVFIFPDPESIRSQLLGFWRDPEHVRFYHAELIEIIARSIGFELVYSNIKANPRDVISFSKSMQPWPKIESSAQDFKESNKATNWWHRLFNKQPSDTEQLKFEIQRLQQKVTLLEERSYASEQTSRKLWTVNQTWAWDDNVTLCLRKTKK